MKLQGKLADVSIDYATKKPKLTFLINNNINSLEEIENVDLLDIEAKKHRNKRRINANNYAWEIISQIGNILSKSKEEIYLEMLKRYGQSQMISVYADIDVSKFLKYYEEAGESELNNKLFKHYKVYTGTSEYDTKEMSIFIDGVVQEAQELGIVTDTPEQIARYKEAWK